MSNPGPLLQKVLDLQLFVELLPILLFNELMVGCDSWSYIVNFALNESFLWHLHVSMKSLKDK